MNIFIDGIDDIKSIYIVKELSKHDILRLTFRMKAKERNIFEGYLNKEISVKADEEGIKVLFSGIVTDLHIYLNKSSWYCDITALSKTSLMDKEKYTRIFQDTKKTIKSIIDNIYNDYNFDVFFPKKEKIDAQYSDVLIQYNETDWQFINRLCALCNLHIYSNSENDVLSWIGEPDRSAEDIQEYELVAINSTSGSLSYDIQINDIYNIGDIIKYNRKEYSITKIVYELINNYLYKTYTILEKKECDEFHINFEGLIFPAKVLEVDGKSRVKVQFDIEKEKPANPIWICWSTPYSCSNLDIYCMPEPDEKVNVKFMSNDCKKIFAENNIRKTEISNDIKISDKLFKIGEKQLLFSENGIMIKNNKCEIIIENDKLSISNEKCKIEVDKTIKMSIDNLSAEIKDKEIILDTGSDKIKLGNSAIKIETEKIEINADKVNISAKNEMEINASSEKINMKSSGTEISTKKMNVK